MKKITNLILLLFICIAAIFVRGAEDTILPAWRGEGENTRYLVSNAVNFFNVPVIINLNCQENEMHFMF